MSESASGNFQLLPLTSPPTPGWVLAPGPACPARLRLPGELPSGLPEAPQRRWVWRKKRACCNSCLHLLAILTFAASALCPRRHCRCYCCCCCCNILYPGSRDPGGKHGQADGTVCCSYKDLLLLDAPNKFPLRTSPRGWELTPDCVAVPPPPPRDSSMKTEAGVAAESLLT